MPKAAKKTTDAKGTKSAKASKSPTPVPLRTQLPSWEFSLLYPGFLDDYTEADIDALYEAGCDDATISSSRGTISITFHREAPSFKSALLSAIHDVEKSGVKLELAGVEIDG